MQGQANSVFFDNVHLSNDEILELFAMQTVLGTWRFEIDGDVGLISSNICRILEFTPDSNVAPIDVVLKNVHPDDRSMVFACFAKAAETGSSLECLYRIVRPESPPKYVRTVGRILVNANGKREIIGATYEENEAIRSLGYVE